MAYSEVYGLKFDYKNLRELLREKYAFRAAIKYEKYLLPYMVDKLSEDLLKTHPKWPVRLFCTGFCDMVGEDCVLGIEISRYELFERSWEKEGSEPTVEVIEELEDRYPKFDEIDDYCCYRYGHIIHRLNHLIPSHKTDHDPIIESMKKLVGGEKVAKMTPCVYRVEDCAC